LNQKHCNLILPEKDKKILKFENHHYSSKLPFTIYCDFESNNIPLETSQSDPNESYTKKIFKQEVNSYGIYISVFDSNIILYVFLMFLSFEIPVNNFYK
jgi:hypothetical protein